MKKLILLVALALTACGADPGTVTDTHIRAAGQVCQSNGGVSGIRKAYKQGRTESCGYRCLKPTGQFLYSANVECNNGAYFNLNFVE